MSAYALDLGGPADEPRRPARATAAPSTIVEPVYAAGGFAAPDDMKRPRYVQAIFTFLSPRIAPLTIGPALPQAALARVLDELDRHPRKVSVYCNPATPEDIEIRDEAGRDAPRLLLAIVHAGLSLAEAQTALLALQSNPNKR
jgi:hypothetical protein